MSSEPRSFGPKFFSNQAVHPAGLADLTAEPSPRPLSWKKDAPIQVFVTADFRRRVNAAAHDARVSMSEYVRRALEAYLSADENTGGGAA